ncbi:MAG: hypothetical protein MJ252_24110 [archaeon]|nr:hypothetical protein [archaeon]
MGEITSKGLITLIGSVATGTGALVFIPISLAFNSKEISLLYKLRTTKDYLEAPEDYKTKMDYLKKISVVNTVSFGIAALVCLSLLILTLKKCTKTNFKKFQIFIQIFFFIASALDFTTGIQGIIFTLNIKRKYSEGMKMDVKETLKYEILSSSFTLTFAGFALLFCVFYVLFSYDVFGESFDDIYETDTEEDEYPKSDVNKKTIEFKDASKYLEDPLEKTMNV